MADLIDLVLHVDVYLLDLVKTYGAWIYGMLFAIVFAETGLVVTPFLPGDSLLFAAGALAASGALDVRVLLVLLVAAAVAGDAVNYSVGRAIGTRVIRRAGSRSRAGAAGSIRRTSPRRTSSSSATAARRSSSARFMPIVRTFVPFVAGAAEMTYPSFAFYNVTGGDRLGRRLCWAPATSSATCRS